MKNYLSIPARLVLLALVVCSLTHGPLIQAGTADNWPQWRGPLQTGVAPEANPPTTWSEGSNVKWKVKIPGDGTSTPIIWENLVFVQTAIPSGKKVDEKAAASPQGDAQPPNDRQPSGPGPAGGPPGGRRGGRGGGMQEKPTEAFQFALLCLDRQTGKVLWQQTAAEQVPHEGLRAGDGSFAAMSGLTDGKNIYAFFGSRGLYCYDFKGKLIWKQDLGKLRIKNGFGEGSSPAIYKDSLIINWDNEDGSFITALDKNTGKTLWKENRDEATTWSTPLIVSHGGKTQVVTSGTRKIRSYDADSGKLIWECKGLTANVIPSPVADAEKVYCISGFGGSALLAIRLDAMGDVSDTDAVVWRHKQATPYVPSPLLYNGKLYFYGVNSPRLSCLDSGSGKVFIDAERVEGLGNTVYASPLGASRRIYLTGRDGSTVVLKQSDKLEPLATNKLDDKIDASPAAAGKDLFLRGRQYLYCLAEK
jgi:outer membrane protein assembly factor BamB